MCVVIIEGPDGTGKTTVAKSLTSVHHWLHYHKQPNPEGILNHINKLVRTNTKITASERQLFHCINNCMDLYVNIPRDNYILFDRSPISTIAYGYMYGVPDHIMDPIIEIYKSVFRNKFKDTEIVYLFFTSDEPLKIMGEDEHEKNCLFSDMVDAYNMVFESLQHGKLRNFLSRNEKMYTIDVTGLNKTQAYIEASKTLFGNWNRR